MNMIDEQIIKQLKRMVNDRTISPRQRNMVMEAIRYIKSLEDEINSLSKTKEDTALEQINALEFGEVVEINIPAVSDKDIYGEMDGSACMDEPVENLY